MQRRKFSREFTFEAVKLVRDRGVSVAQAARDLDVHENVLRKWVRDHEADPGSAFPGHGVMRPEQQELERLRRENARLKAERDILKKAAAYFARDSIRGSPSSRSTGGSGRCRGHARRSGSRAAAFTPGYRERRARGRGRGRGVMRPLGRGCGPASSAAIALTAPAGSGTIFWPKACHAVCTASNG